MSNVLDYSRSEPWFHNKKLRKFAIWLLILGAIAAAIYYGPTAWRRLSLLYWQSQCENFEVKPGTIVAAFDANNFTSSRSENPACATEFSKFLPPGSTPIDGHVFLHRRNCLAGPRIISVYAESWRGSHSLQQDEGWILIHIYVTEPGGFLSQPKQTASYSTQTISAADYNTVGPRLNAADSLVYIYAGEIDETDEAVFKIPCSVLNRYCVLYFRLTDAGDYVKLVKTFIPDRPDLINF